MVIGYGANVQVQVQGPLDVTEHLHSQTKVKVGRIGVVSAQHTDSECQVRAAYDSQVINRANNRLVKLLSIQVHRRV